MVDKNKELEDLLAALNHSAERMQALWFSFMGISLYVILTALTTTHRMLLLEEAQTLPILGMKVPLLPFYILAPIIFIVVHFYALLMLVLLARSAKAFEDQLQQALPLRSQQESFRLRLENTLFLQILLGTKPERTGIAGFLLGLMAWLTLVVLPIATLLVLQVKFLPYHHFAITWAHRVLVLLDLVGIAVLWRGYRWRWGARAKGGQSKPIRHPSYPLHNAMFLEYISHEWFTLKPWLFRSTLKHK